MHFLAQSLEATALGVGHEVGDLLAGIFHDLVDVLDLGVGDLQVGANRSVLERCRVLFLQLQLTEALHLLVVKHFSNGLHHSGGDLFRLFFRELQFLLHVAAKQQLYWVDLAARTEAKTETALALTAALSFGHQGEREQAHGAATEHDAVPTHTLILPRSCSVDGVSAGVNPNAAAV